MCRKCPREAVTGGIILTANAYQRSLLPQQFGILAVFLRMAGGELLGFTVLIDPLCGGVVINSASWLE